MELKEDIVDIIVPFYKTEKGIERLEQMKESLQKINPGFPYRLIIAEGQKPCVQNRNDGLKQSNTRYFIMCDDDVIFIQENWLKEAMETIQTIPDCGAVGFRIEDLQGKVIHGGRMILPKADKNYSVNCLEVPGHDVTKQMKKHQVAGCCILIDRLIAGYYPENIYPGKINSEDIDYQMTIQANGFLIWYLGTVAIVHNESTLAEKIKKYKLTAEDLTNHIIFAKRWDIVNGKVVPKQEEKTEEEKK